MTREPVRIPRRQVFTAHETHIFNPNLFNAFRFGVSRVVAVTGLTFPSGNALVADTSFATVPGLNAAAINVRDLRFSQAGSERALTSSSTGRRCKAMTM